MQCSAVRSSGSGIGVAVAAAQCVCVVVPAATVAVAAILSLSSSLFECVCSSVIRLRTDSSAAPLPAMGDEAHRTC